MYATFLGGSLNDDGNGIALDQAGSVYVTGETISGDFPITPNAFDPSFNGGSDVFVVKLNPFGSGLAYATFLGLGEGAAVAVDDAGDAFVTGLTSSSIFPATPGAFDPSYNGGTDAFLARLNAAGSGLVYATFLGGMNWDDSGAVAVDGTGSAYVAGLTESSDFPTTPGAFDRILERPQRCLRGQANPAGNNLVYATYLGGSANEFSDGIAVDEAGTAYVTGTTLSRDLPTTPSAFDQTIGGGMCGGGTYTCSDAFVARLSPVGSELIDASYLGGNDTDIAIAIAIPRRGGQRLCDGQNLVYQLPHHAGRLRYELQRRQFLRWRCLHRQAGHGVRGRASSCPSNIRVRVPT